MFRPSSARLVLLSLVAAFVLGGCYSMATPSYNPGDQRDVLASIVRRGIVVTDPEPGQTACDDPSLVGNSLFLRARLPDETEAHDVYVHTFREKSWTASKAAVDACQAKYQAAHPDSDVVRLDIPTFRVFGDDWSPELTRELSAAFEEAAHAGTSG